MAVDLHTHSTASDGTSPPAEVVRLAAEAGLTAVALTDHDTTEGVAAARTAAREAGVELIAGVELSCEWEPGTMHLLALFLPPGTGPLQDRLAGLRAGRDERNRDILDRLREMGMDIHRDELRAEAGSGSAGRPHIAALLVRKGYASDIADAFQRFLARGRPAYAPRPRLAPEEAIRLTRASRAVAVLAHPHTLGIDGARRYGDVLERMADWGLGGVECHYGEYAPSLRRKMAQTAARFGLAAAGGSDFHGEYRPGVRVGKGRGDLSVPDSVLEELRAALPGGVQ